MSQIGALFGGLFGDAGQNFVNEQGGSSKVFGKKPDVAPYVPIDLGAETGKATAANLENLPGISALLDKVIPNFSELIQTGTDNALALSRGQLPQTDINALQRSSAYKALQGGYGGTPMAHALGLRDLGIGILQGQEAGANLATTWTNLAEGAYSPFTISTGQQAGTTAANNAGIQAMKQFEFNVKAAPNPGAAGVFQLDKELGMTMLSFGLGAAGGAIAGGGGTNYGAPTPAAAPSQQPYTWQTAPTWSGGG